ncbi:MAG: peptidoglycan DD-metalloendopeptidase family protein [Maribacter sp.]
MISSVIDLDHQLNAVFPLDASIAVDAYCALDLSISNHELNDVSIVNPVACQQYIDKVLQKHNAKVAYGGYLEKRNIYRDKLGFSEQEFPRDIHLGIDFWAPSDTKVIAPLKGKVHSFQNNSTIGDYGPTIILSHEIEGFKFHTLYGHLSLASIENINVGQEFLIGDCIGTLGTSDINVNYAPHLHFQIIIDMEGMKGDYPGVCSENTLKFYTKNCPNPNLLLQLPA